MNRPKYKELYLEEREKYKKMKYWTKYILDTLESNKIIEKRRKTSSASFEDIFVIRVLPNKEELFLAFRDWGLDLIEGKED